MANKCEKCRKNITEKHSIQCAECQKFFHLHCTSISEKMFFLMTPNNRKKAKCDTCQYGHRESSTSHQINIPTENSFEKLCEEDIDRSIQKYNEFVTLREKKKPASEPDLSASYLSLNETWAHHGDQSKSLNKTFHSQPDITIRDTTFIEKMKEENRKLKLELQIANNEIDNLNLINKQLTEKTKKQEKIIELFKTVSIDDINKSINTNGPRMSTPLGGRKQQKDIMYSSADKSKPFVKKTISPVKTRTAKNRPEDKTKRNKCQDVITTNIPGMKTLPKKTAKLCLISNINRNKQATALRNHFADYDVCHYRVPGGGISQILSGLPKKLQDFTYNDFCIIFIGESDFNMSKNYKNLVNEIRTKLASVQHTNVILCVPTFKYSFKASIFNTRVESFNNILYHDNVCHQYCYILDSNKNLECSYRMFTKHTGIINLQGFKVILNDVKNLMINIVNELMCDNNSVDDLAINSKLVSHSFRA